MILRTSVRMNGSREPRAARSAQPVQAEADQWTSGHRPRVCHPCGKLSRQTWLDLNVEDLSTTTAMPGVETNSITMKWMPRIFYNDELRSVCRMT
jgi:hypothetical protein